MVSLITTTKKEGAPVHLSYSTCTHLSYLKTWTINAQQNSSSKDAAYIPAAKMFNPCGTEMTSFEKVLNI